MPLHLLGKKSWNVYNAANIERVRRDEAAAEAREAEHERRMQDEDAARRLAILRGEDPGPALTLPDDDTDDASLPAADKRGERRGFESGGPRKRKRRGEDDTDFEMRLARERMEAGRAAEEELGRGRGRARDKGDEAPIVDATGHIDLVGKLPAQQEPGEEKRRDGRKQKDDTAAPAAPAAQAAEESSHGMRFADAAGRQAGLADGKRPWYASRAGGPSTGPAEEMQVQEVNAFGREDPGRKAREVARIAAGDPLAMMKSGAKRVRELEKDRRKDQEERARELRELGREERRREKRRRREGRRCRNEDDVDSLDGFTLDAPQSPGQESSRRQDRRAHDDRRRDEGRRHEDRYGDRGHRHEEKDRRRSHSDKDRQRRDERHRSHSRRRYDYPQ